MEFSGYIDWKRLDAETKLSNWTLTEELFKNHSLQKHFDCRDLINTDSIDIKQDKDTSMVINATPKIPEPRIPYPRISDLSIEEQKYFLDTYKEYIFEKEIGCEKLNRLQNLMWKLSSEQEEFLGFLQQHSLSAKDDYNFLHPQVRKEIQNILQNWRCHVEQNIAPFYTLFQTVGLSSGAVFPNDPILCYKRTLKQAMGQYLLRLPDIKTSQKSLLESNKPDTCVPTYYQISQDSCSCSLASENAAHFVLTAEALQTLIDNHPTDYEKDWELPITVTDQLKDSNKTASECLKTIMIDDPLPPKCVKPREANAMYYRRKVCDILRKPRDNQEVSSDMNKCGRTLEKNGNLPETMEIGNDFTNEEDHLTPNSKIIQDLCQDADILFDLASKSVNDHQTKSNKLSLEEENCPDGNTNNDCGKVNQNLAVPQFTYSLWTFGSLNLLIRTNECGLLYQASNDSKGSLHPANVFVKPEYQLTYGYEQITTSEASRWWINTYINQDSLCICARVNPLTSELLRLDVLNQSNILTLSSFDPAARMKMIHGILTRLEKLLSPGKYILTHSAKDLHICIYEVLNDENGAAAKKASYDLHLVHSKDRVVIVDYEKFFPWVPIDPNVFLDWHIAYHRIPLTFPPVSKEELKKIKNRNARVGKKKKKGKKTKNTQACEFKRKADHGQMEVKSFIDLKALNNQSNYPTDTEEQAENKERTSISQRLRSRAKPVTYGDDIDFDF